MVVLNILRILTSCSFYWLGKATRTAILGSENSFASEASADKFDLKQYVQIASEGLEYFRLKIPAVGI